jgi:hypothetical protein
MNEAAYGHMRCYNQSPNKFHQRNFLTSPIHHNKKERQRNKTIAVDIIFAHTIAYRPNN